MDNSIALDFENSFHIITDVKNKLKTNLYIKGSTVYYISNNKIKKGIIIDIVFNKFYVCKFRWFPFFKKEMVPGQIPVNETSSPGPTKAMVQIKAAARCSAEMSSSCFRSRFLLVASSLVPDQIAEKMPGAPPITSQAIPESSAKESWPVASKAARALIMAFSKNVVPLSIGSGPE